MFKDIAIRITNAEKAFDETLMNLASISAKEAAAVRNGYLKHKLAKLSIGIGSINVTHGAYLDKDVILRAVDKFA